MADEVTHFDTGAVRSADRKAERFDLISPIGLKRLAQTCHEGAVKYSDFNWEKGMPVHDLLNHGIAHIYLYLSGDRSEDHLAHAAWNCFSAMHSEELWPSLSEGKLRGPGCAPPKVQPRSGNDPDNGGDGSDDIDLSHVKRPVLADGAGIGDGPVDDVENACQ